MRVLFGCEESQEGCKAFRIKGHEAYSCDLQECSGGHPEWHLQIDVFTAIKEYGPWDLIVLHPPCTAMAVSGNRWYGKDKPNHWARLAAIEWTKDLWNTACAHCDKVVAENPVSVVFQHLSGTLQYIQPHMFGHGEVKKTGLMLHGVQPLMSTNNVAGREPRIWKMGPSKDRAKMRSKSYTGIMTAMADQWT